MTRGPRAVAQRFDSWSLIRSLKPHRSEDIIRKTLDESGAAKRR